MFSCILAFLFYFLITFYFFSFSGKRVGRSTAMLKPEEIIEQVDTRTIAASPLEYTVKLEDVESFFGKYGKVCSAGFSVWLFLEARFVFNSSCSYVIITQ